MKKLLAVVVAVVVLGVVALRLPTVQNTLVAMTLPEFPEWPQPLTRLAANDRGTIYFRSASPFDFDVILGDMASATPTTGLGYLSYPEEASVGHPVPAMILLHGSGGISPGRERDYAEFLNGLGIAAFVIDYYQPRGITEDTNYIYKVSAVTEFDVVTDAYAALRLLSTSPLIEGSRIGVMGFSYGGMATRFAMDDRFRQALAPEHPGFSLHVDVYGPCFQNLQTRRSNGAPLLTLRGTEDKSNDLAACEIREQQLRDLGVEVEAKIYEGAGHAWENDTPRFLSEDSPYIEGCEVRYDEQGLSLLNGERVVDYSSDADRVERIVARLSSGPAFQDCLRYGYLIGNDGKTRERGYADLESFLQRHWPRGTAGTASAEVMSP